MDLAGKWLRGLLVRKERWQGLLSCRARMVLVAPGEGRKKWRSQAWAEVPGQQAQFCPETPEQSAAPAQDHELFQVFFGTAQEQGSPFLCAPPPQPLCCKETVQ